MNKKIKLFDPTGAEVPLETMVFSGGEIKVRILGLRNENYSGHSRIEAMLLNSEDVMTLVMLVNACRNHGYSTLRLMMPYIPYARQDRKCNEGEAFSLEAFAFIINGLGFTSIVAYDPHSRVASECFKNLLAVSSHELIRKHTAAYHWICRSIWSGVPMYLVCPDKGAFSTLAELNLKRA